MVSATSEAVASRLLRRLLGVARALLEQLPQHGFVAPRSPVLSPPSAASSQSRHHLPTLIRSRRRHCCRRRRSPPLRLCPSPPPLIPQSPPLRLGLPLSSPIPPPTTDPRPTDDRPIDVRLRLTTPSALPLTPSSTPALATPPSTLQWTPAWPTTTWDVVKSTIRHHPVAP